MSSNARSTSDAQQQTAITIDDINYNQPTFVIHNTTTIPNIETANLIELRKLNFNK